MVALPAALDRNPREVIGANNPPETSIDRARVYFTDISKFLTENPVIQDEETAKESAKIVDRGRKMLVGLDQERRSQTDPLNDQVKSINAIYKKPTNLIQSLLDELAKRLTAFARAEEERRAAEAEAKRREAEEAERIAREAEAKEREAKENAEAGELTNISAAIAEADQSFSDFQKADRVAARAEREIPVRLGTGMGKAVSMRTKEILAVEDWQKAISEIGLNEGIREAILTAARAYRKLHGKLPAGITSQTERSI